MNAINLDANSFWAAWHTNVMNVSVGSRHGQSLTSVNEIYCATSGLT